MAELHTAQGRLYLWRNGARRAQLQLPQAAPFFIDAGLPPAPGSSATSATDTRWPRAGMTPRGLSSSATAAFCPASFFPKPCSARPTIWK